MKYAPAREDGKKPYVVAISEWGRHRERLVWATNVSGARYAAIGRGGVGVGIRQVRRATPADMPGANDG